MRPSFLNKSMFVTAAIVGSFLIYCGQTALNQSADGSSSDRRSAVRDARAQGGEGGCCSAPQFTLIKEGILSAPYYQSDAIDVSKFREVILYGSAKCSPSEFRIMFYSTGADGKAVYSAVAFGGGVRIPIHSQKLYVRTDQATCKDAASYSLVGIN